MEDLRTLISRQRIVQYKIIYDIQSLGNKHSEAFYLLQRKKYDH
jgi:hypothetical protein